MGITFHNPKYLPCVNSKMRHFQNRMTDHRPEQPPKIDSREIQTAILSRLKEICSKVKPIAQFVKGGLYVGSAGVAYAYYHVAKNENFATMKEGLLQQGVEFLEPALTYSATGKSGDKFGFLSGSAGVTAVAAAIFKAVGKEDLSNKHVQQYASMYKICLPVNFLRTGGDELFVGRAGYLAGIFWLRRELGVPVVDNEVVHEVCSVIVKSGREYSKRHKSPCPLMYAYHGTEYLGAAHGIAFILQMLITAPGFLQSEPRSAQHIKESIDYLLSLQTEDGNFPSSLDAIRDSRVKDLVHWCHGAPGVVYLMAKAYLVYRERKYLDSCIKSAELVWQKGLLKKGGGICHGVAGSANVFLLLYRLTHEPKYLHRAHQFFRFLDTEEFKTGSRTPDSPFSLYEGESGTVCFLSDLLTPKKSEFPFDDVFSM